MNYWRSSLNFISRSWRLLKGIDLVSNYTDIQYQGPVSYQSQNSVIDPIPVSRYSLLDIKTTGLMRSTSTKTWEISELVCVFQSPWTSLTSWHWPVGEQWTSELYLHMNPQSCTCLNSQFQLFMTTEHFQHTCTHARTEARMLLFNIEKPIIVG